MDDSIHTHTPFLWLVCSHHKKDAGMLHNIYILVSLNRYEVSREYIKSCFHCCKRELAQQFYQNRIRALYNAWLGR